MPAKYSECIAATCTFDFMEGNPAGFQKADVASFTVAACAPPMPSARAPTPMDKNSLLYFGGCAFKTKEQTISRNRITVFNFINGCFRKVTCVFNIYCVDF